MLSSLRSDESTPARKLATVGALGGVAAQLLAGLPGLSLGGPGRESRLSLTTFGRFKS